MRLRPRRPLVWLALCALVYAGLFCGVGLAGLPAEDAAPRQGLLTGQVRAADAYGVILTDARFRTGEESRPCGDLRLWTDQGPLLHQGQVIEAEAILSPLRNEGNPGAFDARRWGYSIGQVYQAEAVTLAVTGEATLPLMARARESLLSTIQRLWPDEPLLPALLLGEDEALSPALRQAYARSGTAHLLAVSGLHVGFVAGLCGLLLGFLNKRSWLRLGLTAAFLGFYCLLCGATASVSRACLMILVYRLCGQWGRGADRPSALGLAATLLLLIDPRQLLSASFQLSFLALTGIVCIQPWIEKALEKAPKGLAALGLSLSAQIGVLPLLCRLYAGVSVSGLVANLLLVPLSGAVVALGLPTAALGLVWPQAAAFLAAAVGLLADTMNRVATLFAGEGSFVFLPAASKALCWLWPFLLYLASPFLWEREKRTRLALVSTGAAALAVCLTLWLGPRLRAPLTVTQLSVGCADCAVLKEGSTRIVIDTGATGEEAVAALQSDLPYADALFLTHGDADHAGGATFLLHNTGVKAVYYPKGMESDADFRPLWLEMGERGIEAIPLSSGDTLSVGKMRVTVLWPAFTLSAHDNAGSLVLLVEAEGRRFLYTGDITEETLSSLRLPRADVLKLPHHGSRSGLSARDLSDVEPALLLLSVGPNGYGLPAEETLRLCEGYPLLRTDEAAAVVTFKGGSLRAENYRPLSPFFR